MDETSVQRLHLVKPAPPPAAPVQPVAPRRRFWLLAAIGVVACAGLAAGLLLFVATIDQRESALLAQADGIVVLTGGPDRIGDGVELLAEGKAKRMLITGVKPGVTLETIGKPLARHKPLLECCVDVDYAALNTEGNAAAARNWLKQHAYRSLIVVTSNYHMPRALVEFRRAMPDVPLYSYPVSSERDGLRRWWHDAQVARLVFMEYGKFVVAWCRMQLSRFPPALRS